MLLIVNVLPIANGLAFHSKSRVTRVAKWSTKGGDFEADAWITVAIDLLRCWSIYISRFSFVWPSANRTLTKLTWLRFWIVSYASNIVDTHLRGKWPIKIHNDGIGPNSSTFNEPNELRKVLRQKSLLSSGNGDATGLGEKLEQIYLRFVSCYKHNKNFRSTSYVHSMPDSLSET